MKLQTKEDAECVMAHGIPSVNNRRHYLRYGGVFYPVPSVVWMLETGEWPKSTPRHLDNDPSNNDFGNLRKPGRAKKPRKKVEKTVGEVVTTALAAAQTAQADSPVMAYLTKAISDNAAQVRSLFDPA